MTSVAVRYSLPIFGKFGNSSGSSETQVDLTFEEDGNALSKVEESSHEVTSDEPFIRSFVTNGHSAKVSVSFEAEGDKVTKEETVDLSGLLVGDKVRKARIPFAKFLKGVTMQLHVEKMHVERAEAEAEEGEQEEDQSNEPAYVPCKFLTPDLVDLLNPFVFKISALESLPDRPATIAQLDDLCEPVSIRYTFYDTGSGQKTSSTGTPLGYGEEIWYKGLESGEWTANEVNTVSYRDVKVGGLRVYFLGDCDEDEIYKHFDYDKIPIEVHDRLPTPEDMPNVQIQPEGGEEGEDAKQAEEAAMARSGDKSSAQEGHKTSYVCGLAHISLREFCMGYTSYDNEVNIFPYTSIRGGADLDWKTRPGRYVESGSQVTYLARMAKSLKDPAKHRYFQRAVFLMEYNDNLLLRSILDLVTSVNQQALKLKGSKAYILQTLATYKFDEAQAKSTDLDVLTGFQVIDKSMRLIVVEGLKNGHVSREGPGGGHHEQLHLHAGRHLPLPKGPGVERGGLLGLGNQGEPNVETNSVQPGLVLRQAALHLPWCPDSPHQAECAPGPHHGQLPHPLWEEGEGAVQGGAEEAHQLVPHHLAQASRPHAALANERDAQLHR